MDEARNLKSILYPLSRDIRNLQTFLANIRNILQAQPDRFALAAPPGLMSLRKTLKSLSASTKAIQEVNDIALRESALAEELSENAMSLVLRPAARLRDATRAMNNPVNQAHSLVTRLNGYLSPLFVFSVSAGPEVESMQRDVTLVEQRLADIKKSVTRLTDQELIVGLSQTMESQLSVVRPQLQEVEQEVEDIAEQMALLMGKMNKLSKLSSRLHPLMRMAAVMDGAIQDLVPAMTTLKYLGSALTTIKNEARPGQSLTEQLDEILQRYDLPMDALIQLEYTLRHQVEHYIHPVLEPLAELAEQLKGDVPTNHQLHGLESTLLAQQNRFTHAGKRIDRIFDVLEPLVEQAKLPLYAG